MANAIPLLEGTDVSGGFLVRDTYAFGLYNTINRRAAVMQQSRIDRVPGKRQKYTVYAGRPTATFVNEGAAKGVTGAEFAEVQVDVKKIATNVIYTEELLEDAQDDPTVLVNADVEGAFADLIDAHALGQANGTAITSQFNNSLVATTQTAEYDQTKADGFALAVSSAVAQIEANGGNPNGIIAGFPIRAHMRDARATYDTTQPVYGTSQNIGGGSRFGGVVDTLYGLPISWTTNLAQNMTPAAGKVLAIVGDFTHSVGVIRKDMTIRKSDQATVDVSGTLNHLWQQNKVAVQWEMRVGYFVHDLNRMFVAITNGV